MKRERRVYQAEEIAHANTCHKKVFSISEKWQGRQCVQNRVSTWKVEEGEAVSITKGQITFVLKDIGRTLNFVL